MELDLKAFNPSQNTNVFVEMRPLQDPHQEHHFSHKAPDLKLCPRCGEVETPIHLRRDYGWSQQIWASLLGPLLPSLFTPTIHQWCMNNTRHITPYLFQDIPWYLVFSFRIWNIWLARNNLIFAVKIHPFPVLSSVL